MRRRAPRRCSTAIWPTAPACVLADGVAADAARMCRASAAACCTRRRRCSRSGFGAVCLLNSDSPTLPTALLVRAARALLAPGERVVLGPAEDGGYYLLGMKQPHAHLFADIAWSTDSVAAATRARAAALGLEVVDAADLVRRG